MKMRPRPFQEVVTVSIFIGSLKEVFLLIIFSFTDRHWEMLTDIIVHAEGGKFVETLRDRNTSKTCSKPKSGSPSPSSSTRGQDRS